MHIFASNQKNGIVGSYGLGIFGDGTTIVRKLMMDILASSPSSLSCVLDIEDCMTWKIEGQIKHAWNITKTILTYKKLILTKVELMVLILMVLSVSKKVQLTGSSIFPSRHSDAEK